MVEGARIPNPPLEMGSYVLEEDLRQRPSAGRSVVWRDLSECAVHRGLEQGVVALHEEVCRLSVPVLTAYFFSRARATKFFVPSGKPTTTTPSTAPAAQQAVEVRGSGGREPRHCAAKGAITVQEDASARLRSARV